MTIYCNNECEAEATHFYRTKTGEIMALCWTCKESFLLGQANPQARLLPVSDLGEGEGEDWQDDDPLGFSAVDPIETFRLYQDSRGQDSPEAESV